MRLLFVPLLVLGLVVAGCGPAQNSSGADGTRVVASFYPLAFAAREVGGDLVTVENLTPPGAEPHALELTTGKVRSLVGADLVIYLGGGFQPAVEAALGDVEGVAVDALADQQDLLGSTPHGEEEEHAHEEEQPDEEEHAGEAFDPHVWLDPLRMSTIARVVGDRLSEVDPGNASNYESRAAELVKRLEELDAEYRSGLAACERRILVTSHQAFGYLADAYRLEQVGIAGIDPEAEPSPARLAEVARFVRENDVTTIFFEVLVSPAIAETVAQETGAKTATLDPLEGPPDEGDYFTAMRANLAALERALDCS